MTLRSVCMSVKQGLQTLEFQLAVKNCNSVFLRFGPAYMDPVLNKDQRRARNSVRDSSAD